MKAWEHGRCSKNASLLQLLWQAVQAAGLHQVNAKKCKERSKRTVGGGYTIPNVAELVVTVDLSVVVANACKFSNKSTATACEPKTGGKLECNKRAQ